MVDDKTRKARENSSKGNGDIEALRKFHRVHLSRYTSVTLRARPIAADQVCSHSKLFWFGSAQLHKRSFFSDPRDVQMHDFLSIRTNHAPQYDELSKVTANHFSVDLRRITMTMKKIIRNSTELRAYEL